MKKIILAIAALFLLTTASATEGVDFRDITFPEALMAANSEGKYIFVDCYTSWCMPCKLMAGARFPLKVMGDYFNPLFVSVKYDCENNEDGIRLAKEYNVTAYPTFLIFRPDGSFMKRVVGGAEANDFILKVEDSFDHDKVFEGISNLYEKYGYASLKKHIDNYNGPSDTLLKEDLNRILSGLAQDAKTDVDYWFIYSTINFVEKGSLNERFLLDNADIFRAKNGKDKVDKRLRRHHKNYLTEIIRGKDNMTVRDAMEYITAVRSLGLKGSNSLEVYCNIAQASKEKDLEAQIDVLDKYLLSTDDPKTIYFGMTDYFVEHGEREQKLRWFEIGDRLVESLPEMERAQWYDSMMEGMRKRYL